MWFCDSIIYFYNLIVSCHFPFSLNIFYFSLSFMIFILPGLTSFNVFLFCGTFIFLLNPQSPIITVLISIVHSSVSESRFWFISIPFHIFHLLDFLDILDVISLVLYCFSLICCQYSTQFLATPPVESSSSQFILFISVVMVICNIFLPHIYFISVWNS